MLERISCLFYPYCLFVCLVSMEGGDWRRVIAWCVREREKRYKYVFLVWHFYFVYFERGCYTLEYTMREIVVTEKIYRERGWLYLRIYIEREIVVAESVIQ